MERFFRTMLPAARDTREIHGKSATTMERTTYGSVRLLYDVADRVNCSLDQPLRKLNWFGEVISDSRMRKSSVWVCREFDEAGKLIFSREKSG